MVVKTEVLVEPEVEVEHTEIFKPFIDDIVWLSFGNQATQNIKTKLSETFAKYDLTLKYREINTTEENGELELLDILHKISPHSQFRFITTGYVKLTALDRCLFKVLDTTQLQYSNRLCSVNQFDFDV